ncbi:diglucosyl diacylglycerol synthase [Bacillus salitolerans]|uniref:Diglucosyl diacylglycerol synthase n=1 Tax=Bacillus salitolerans TaxID=1437434 RepID=A0ABW4LW95_9BACI
MSNRPKILILTASYGNGHMQVAKTLQNICFEKGIRDVTICDFFAETYPIMTDITQYLYLKCFTIGPQFYRMFYYGVERFHNKKVSSWYKNFGMRRLTHIIGREQPNIIINTFPINVVPEFRNNTGIVIPTFNVLTDFCLHRIWIHHAIDKYYVSNEDLKRKMVRFGVPSFKVFVSGIPIRSTFEKQLKPSVLYKKYGLDPSKKVVLLMAGAHGVLKNTKELCKGLLSDPTTQVLVICGKNESLKEDLEEIKPHFSGRLHIFGYVERVDEMFRMATCMITKPGGITLSEAAAMGLPVILYRPVPGQEKENALYFQKKGAAIIVNRQEEVIDETRKLLTNDQKLLYMKSQMKQIHKENAAQSIIDDILLESKMFTRNELLQSIYS